MSSGGSGALGALVNVVKDLHPALAVLKGIYDIYDGVQYNKKRCYGLVDRAYRVLVVINTELNTSRTRPKPDNVRRLEEVLEYIRQVMRNYAALSFVPSLIRSEEIKRAIEQGHYRLEDCLQLFQANKVAAADPGFPERNAQGREGAPQRAGCVTQEHPGGLAARRACRKAALLIDGRQEDEVMLAMQRVGEIERRAEDTSVEKQILQLGLRSLKKEGRSMAPEWTITSFDLRLYSGPEAQIGAGGFSKVVRGQWKRIDVAVKYVYGDVKPLSREIAVWRQLRHDHIVPFYGASMSAEPPYIVSRYLKNGNMISYLRRNPTMDRVKIVYEVSLGLLYLHGESIVQGDIKGENVLIDDSGKACITDFGLSKVKTEGNTLLYMSNSSIRRPKIAGTPRFMAPEALKEGRQNYKTDVFSFGMLIYQAFTLKVPFADASDKDLHSGRLEPLKKPQEEARGLTNGLWDLHRSCTNANPATRPLFEQIALIMESLSNSWDQVWRKHHSAGPASRFQETFVAKCHSWFKGMSKILLPSSLSFREKRAFHIDFTICDYHATMILEGAEPQIKTYGHLYPVHPEKLSFQYQGSQNSFVSWYSRGYSEAWRIDGQQITRSGPQFVSLEFSGDGVARLWFETFLLYAKGKDPRGSGCYPVPVIFKMEGVYWKRMAKQNVEVAQINLTHPTSPPLSDAWTTLPKPLSYGAVSEGSKTISLTTKFEKLWPPHWTHTLEGRTICTEARQWPEEDVWYNLEERCYTDDEAKLWFTEIKKIVQSWQRWNRGRQMKDHQPAM